MHVHSGVEPRRLAGCEGICGLRGRGSNLFLPDVACWEGSVGGKDLELGSKATASQEETMSFHLCMRVCVAQDDQKEGWPLLFPPPSHFGPLRTTTHQLSLVRASRVVVRKVSAVGGMPSEGGAGGARRESQGWDRAVPRGGGRRAAAGAAAGAAADARLKAPEGEPRHATPSCPPTLMRLDPPLPGLPRSPARSPSPYRSRSRQPPTP